MYQQREFQARAALSIFLLVLCHVAHRRREAFQEDKEELDVQRGRHKVEAPRFLYSILHAWLHNFCIQRRTGRLQQLVRVVYKTHFFNCKKIPIPTPMYEVFYYFEGLRNPLVLGQVQTGMYVQHKLLEAVSRQDFTTNN